MSAQWWQQAAWAESSTAPHTAPDDDRDDSDAYEPHVPFSDAEMAEFRETEMGQALARAVEKAKRIEAEKAAARRIARGKPVTDLLGRLR